MIFWADSIDMLEVNTHTKRIIFLRDHDDVGEPLGAVNLADELSDQESSHLLANRLSLLNGGPRRCSVTGFAFGSTHKWCSASPLRTPGMAEGFHAKMP